MPLMLNTELLLVTFVTVTLAPVAETLPDAVPLLPTVTLPRLQGEGFTVTEPTAVVPVPDSDTVRLGFEASDVIVTVPLDVPDVVGANFTVNVVL